MSELEEARKAEEHTRNQKRMLVWNAKKHLQAWMRLKGVDKPIKNIILEV